MNLAENSHFLIHSVIKDLNTSIGMCYSKLKLHDKALLAFEKAIKDNFDNSETFFAQQFVYCKATKHF